VTATVSRRGLTGLALVVAATLTASACGSNGDLDATHGVSEYLRGIPAGAAAIVGDRRISVEEVQDVTTDLQTYLGSAGAANTGKVNQSGVLWLLIVYPDVVQAASDVGVGVSEDEAAQDLTAHKVTHPSRGAVNVIQASKALDNLQQSGQRQAVQDVGTKLHERKIEVNPRYGHFDKDKLDIVAATPDWLVRSETPAPGAPGTPGAPGGGDPGASGDPGAPGDPGAQAPQPAPSQPAGTP
jgi:hypothetical protein